jgi:hypothetical protein
MFPEAKITSEETSVKEEDWYEWLQGDTCEAMHFDVLRPTKDGWKYIDSVPKANRKPLRWGWKHPKTM